MMNKKESYIYYMNRNQNKLMIYEDNLLPKIFFIQTDAKPKRREVGIAIYTPIDSDKGISHVIEHCIASELYEKLGDRLQSAYVLHNITFYNFLIESNNLKSIFDILNIVLYPEFLRERHIFDRESCNIQNNKDEKVISGVVFNEILSKSKDASYVLLRSIPKALAITNETSGVAGGSIEGILELTYEETVRYYARYYNVKSMCITILGELSFKWQKRITNMCCQINKMNREICVEVYQQKKIYNKSGCEINYVADGNEKKFDELYAICFSSVAPSSKEEYEFYIWLRYCLEKELQGMYEKQVQVEFRNMLDYAYICIIYKNKSDRAAITDISKRVLSFTNIEHFMKTSTDYISENIQNSKMHISNTVLLKYIAEAYFSELPPYTFLISQGKNKKKIEEILKSMIQKELVAIPKNIEMFNGLINRYLHNSKNFAKPEKLVKVNFKRMYIGDIENDKKETKKTSYLKKYKIRNISVYCYDKKEPYIKLYYDLSGVSVHEIVVLEVVLESIKNCLLNNTKDLQFDAKIYPLYCYKEKQHKTFLILTGLTTPQNWCEEINVHKQEILCDIQNLDKLCYLKKTFSNCVLKSIKSIAVTRCLSYFRKSYTHTDALYGIANYLILDDFTEHFSLFIELIEKIFKREVFKYNLKAISTNWEEGIVPLIDKFNSNQGNVIKSNIMHREVQDKKSKEIIVIPGSDMCLVAAGDITSVSDLILAKYKVLCKIITRFYLRQWFREQGIYYGEIDIIEGNLLIIIQNSSKIEVEEITKQINLFLDYNIKEILLQFPYFFKLMRNHKKKLDEDMEILLESCKYTLDFLEIKEADFSLTEKEFRQFQIKLMNLSEKMKMCIICGESWLKNNWIDKEQFEIVNLFKN